MKIDWVVVLHICAYISGIIGFVFIILSASFGHVGWSYWQDFCEQQTPRSDNHCAVSKCLYEHSSGYTDNIKYETHIAYIDCLDRYEK